MISIDLGLLILRLVVGLLFFGHGAQKLFGWFGGHGLEGTGGFFESVDIKPGKFWAAVAGLGEALGGLGLALGFLTPIAGAALIAVMLTAIINVHWENGLWNSNRGIEYPFVSLTIATVISLVGSGSLSLDAALGLSYPMPLTFLVALIVAVVGVVIALGSGTLLGETREEQLGER